MFCVDGNFFVGDLYAHRLKNPELYGTFEIG